MEVVNSEECHLAPHVYFIGCRFINQSAVHVYSDKVNL